MNGTSYRKLSYTAEDRPMPYKQTSDHSNSGAPPVKVLLDGYKGSGLSPPEERSRFNPLNSSRPRSSALLNANDPVAMHLLVETAIGDSQEFEVLSFEEVDELKKEYILLSNRVDAMKRKLALESKVRDAAESLSRLYAKQGRSDSSESGAQRHRRSLLGSRNGSDMFNKTDDELVGSRRKCEELAQELWRLEKRATEIQRRLLHHTAGVLQMTHKTSGKQNDTHSSGPQQRASPGSPGSVYTYSNSRSSMAFRDDQDEFDERSLYRPMEHFNGLGIHQNSGAANSQTIMSAQAKIEDLNRRLRGLIVQINPQQSQAYRAPPTAEQNGSQADPQASLQAQLDYLEQGLADVDEHHRRSEQSMEEKVEEVNTQLEGFIHQMGLSQREPLGPPPELSGHSLRDQLEYLEQGVELVQQHAPNSASNEALQEIDQFKAVLTGLWEIMLSGEEEVRRRENPQHEPVLDREFSLPAFSTKVQWLCGRADSFMEEKDVLRRQIQQQRELNNKSDSAKDAERDQLIADVDRHKRDLEQSDREAANAKQEIAAVMQRLDQARKESTMREQQRSSEDSAATRGHEAKQQEMAKLEAELEELKDDHGIARAELQGKIQENQDKVGKLQNMLQEADIQKQELASNAEQLRSQIEEKTRQVEHAQGEMESLEGEVVRLQTEVTVARAELDGAYGTRAQRAAEVAVNPVLQKEVDELMERNKNLSQELEAANSQKQALGGNSGDMQRQIATLKSELAETIEEYESMTKQSIEFEKDREQLENTIDGFRDRCETLETQLSEERVRMLGMKSPSASGRDSGPAESTSTTTLKNEFKKMMRDTRAENMRALRAEQEERRKLETLVRTLRREPKERKSGLSQSVVA